MKSCHFSLFILIFSFHFSVAQQSTVSSGGKASGSTGNITFSVGEIFINNSIGPGGSLSSGIQQPYEISIITGLSRFDILLSASVFPNPTTDEIILKIGDSFFRDYTYVLYDINGNLLKKDFIKSSVTQIEFGNYNKGVYILIVQNKKLQVKSFKIVKIK